MNRAFRFQVGESKTDEETPRKTFETSSDMSAEGLG